MGLLSNFTLIKKIYVGQNAQTYRGYHHATKKPVVIKILDEAYPSLDSLARFKYEYNLLNTCHGKGTVKCYALENYGNSLAIVMEDFGSGTIQTLVSKQPVNLENFLILALEIIQALEIIHSNHIIHKDINPYNILVDEATLKVKIIDFGISSTLSREEPELQNPQLIEGMISYISPEQTGRMNRGIDYRSDYYSLGCVFYELLTGKVPFESKDAMEVVHRHIAKLPLAPHKINSKIPPVISAIILKLIAKNAELRYQSLFGLKEDLKKCLTQLQENGHIESFPIATRDLSEHLQISEKLYGRENQISTLLKTFEQASQGKAEMILVGGYSGIGKTRLIHEIHKPITQKRGHFIYGKCDQFKRNQPYYCFIECFDRLVKQILTESDEKISLWRNQVLATLSSNAQIAVDLIPSLARIIGKQPAAPKVEPLESQHRINLVLQQFIQINATLQHPLAIFLDDLQWIDSSSLKLLESLLKNYDNRFLLIIGAYRDNEVDAIHPLKVTLETLLKHNIYVPTLKLEPLKTADIKNWIADTLSLDLKKVEPLTQICMEKTKGNPFYFQQFLQQLHKDQLLKFDAEHGGWRFDIDIIHQKEFTDNVVEFMTQKVKELSINTQQVLKLAACIGTYFDIQTLAIISQQSPKDAADALQEAIQAGLITPLDEEYKYIHESSKQNVHYKFLHDRIQLAAYSLIDVNEREAIHVSIARLLYQNSDVEMRKEKTLDIVSHYNQGLSLITDTQEKEAVIKLNLSAAQIVKSSAAYQLAPNYLKIAISLLESNAWKKSYDLTLALYLEAADAAFLINRFDEMNEFIDIVIARSKTLLDKINAYQLRLTYLTGQSKYDEALTLSIAILKSLNINVPSSISKFHLIISLFKTRFALWRKTDSDLLNLPEMTNAFAKASMDILYQASLCAWIVNPKLLAFFVFIGIRLSVKYGLSAVSSMFFVCYGGILSGLNQINAGYRFGKLGLSIANREEQDPSKKPNNFVVYYALIAYKHENIHELLPKVLEVFQSTMNVGNIEMATRALAFYFIFLFYSGEELTHFATKAKEYSNFLLKTNQKKIYYLICGLWKTALILSGHPQEMIEKETGFDEKSAIDFLLNTKDLIRLQIAYLNRAVTSFLQDNIADAYTEVNLMLSYVSQTPAAQIFSFFYSSLIFLVHSENLSDHERKKILKQVKANLKRLKQFADCAPMNYANKYYLILAELARVEGETNKALDYYDQSIELARQNHFINEEAIATELAAKFYLKLGKIKIAKIYMIDAHYAYSRWGALLKSKQLVEKYPELLDQNSATTPNINSQSSLTLMPWMTRTGTKKEILDLSSILKSTQTISKEVLLPDLLRKLINILIENAGAQKGFILLPKNKKWFIEAEAGVDMDTNILKSLPLENKLPNSIINYVIHDKTAVVINNATEDNQFSADPYIQEHQPKSLICLPLLNKNSLSAILYLENNLATNVFTSERIDLLNLLSGQVVISIHNSRIYSAYERFVPQEFLKLLKKKSVMDIVIGDHIEKDMTVLFADMRNFTKLTEKMTPAESFNFINEFLSYIDPMIASHKGFIDKYLGDGIMALFPNGADSALKTAIDMLEFLQSYNVTLSKNNKPAINIGIGINSGLLMLGTVGGEHRMDGTVISDAVNVASRIQDLTKVYKVPLLITEETYLELKNISQFDIRKIDKVLMKGKSNLITIYEVFNADVGAIKELKIKTKKEFDTAITLYQNEKYAEALSIFKKILEINPADLVAKIYFKRCKNNIKSPINHD